MTDSPTQEEALAALDKLKEKCGHVLVDKYNDDWQLLRNYINSQAWQPIETAPMDGTQILLGRPIKDKRQTRAVSQARWNGRCWKVFASNYWSENTPTHWIPLPPPPTGEHHE